MIIAGRAAFKDFFSLCMAMENIRCVVDENLWPDNKSDRMSTNNNVFMDVILYFCVTRNMTCKVDGQARFHFACNSFVQK